MVVVVLVTFPAAAFNRNDLIDDFDALLFTSLLCWFVLFFSFGSDACGCGGGDLNSNFELQVEKVVEKSFEKMLPLEDGWLVAREFADFFVNFSLLLPLPIDWLLLVLLFEVLVLEVGIVDGEEDEEDEASRLDEEEDEIDDNDDALAADSPGAMISICTVELVMVQVKQAKSLASPKGDWLKWEVVAVAHMVQMSH